MRKGKNDDDRLLLFVLCCSLFKNFNPYWVGPTKTSQRYFHRCAAASAVCVLCVPLLTTYVPSTLISGIRDATHHCRSRIYYILMTINFLLNVLFEWVFHIAREESREKKTCLVGLCWR